MRRGSVVLIALTAAASLFEGSPTIVAQAALEDKIKAAIVSKFPQFVEWPVTAFTGRASIDLCVVAADPIESDLAELVSGETLDGRPIAVRSIDREPDLQGCHLLFMRSTAIVRHRSILLKAATLPVLTVSDGQQFLDDGGIVRLRQVDGRMRFDVNAMAAQKAGLRISSQLLQLALTVRGGPR